MARQDGDMRNSSGTEWKENASADRHRTQAERYELRLDETRRERNFFDEHQIVYVWQSKFQSMPLCAVDAQAPSLHASSSISEEGVYETKTDFEENPIGRGGCSRNFALMQHFIEGAICYGLGQRESGRPAGREQTGFQRARGQAGASGTTGVARGSRSGRC